jgi:hypothetical protein
LGCGPVSKIGAGCGSVFGAATGCAPVANIGVSWGSVIGETVSVTGDHLK